MIDSSLTTDVDLLVVGAGQVGFAAGIALSQASRAS
jgi:cation diffusion facilitator CzcD-associated flavoprotein CzcO